MKPGPTLADTLYRETFSNRSIFTTELRGALQRARKFVLDKDMSAFLADLGWSAYKAKPKDAIHIVDEARKHSRLPYAITWIEWDEVALATRARSQYSSTMSPDIVPLKSGWLLLQHPQIETAVTAVMGGIQHHTYHDGAWQALEEPTLGLAPFCFTWRTDDGPLPYKPIEAIQDVCKTRGISQSGILTGIPAYDCPQIGTCRAEDYFHASDSIVNAQVRAIFAETTGMLRYVFALLSTINDLPIKVQTVTAAKGFVARGQYRKFLDHSTITLTVPETRYRALARHVVTVLRRRAHMVRGHWRNDWRNPLTPMCLHEFEASEGLLTCKKCHGIKLWITEHQRGDAALGFVTHDYVVTTEKPDEA